MVESERQQASNRNGYVEMRSLKAEKVKKSNPIGDKNYGL